MNDQAFSNAAQSTNLIYDTTTNTLESAKGPESSLVSELLPVVSQMRIRSESIDTIAQNPCAQSCTGSTPSFNIATDGNNLSLKHDDALRLHFENASGLPTSKASCDFEEVKKLRHLWLKAKADFISLVKT